MRILLRMRPPCDQTGFMIAPRPQGWVQFGESWGLWWDGRQIANVQPSANGVAVILSCRKLWQDKRVSAASVSQGKRYAERWCAARVLEDVPMKEAVARLVGDRPVAPTKAKRAPVETPQERRLMEALRLDRKG